MGASRNVAVVDTFERVPATATPWPGNYGGGGRAGFRFGNSDQSVSVLGRGRLLCVLSLYHFPPCTLFIPAPTWFPYPPTKQRNLPVVLMVSNYLWWIDFDKWRLYYLASEDFEVMASRMVWWVLVTYEVKMVMLGHCKLHHHSSRCIPLIA